MCNSSGNTEPAPQYASQSDKPLSKRATAPAVVAPDAEYFSGVIKSYNERRGFGFLACDATAQRFGRDVYLSKIESVAAIREGERQLKEGDYVRFAVVLSVEGFPQAAAARRLHMVCGTVRTFCKEQGGIITCSEGEVFLQANDCGCLLLHPGDEVSFCLERPANGAPEAKLLKLVHTARPVASLLGCFSLEFPREGQKSVTLDGHAFANCVCFSGLPTDMGESEMSKIFAKLGATQVTVAHAPNGGFSSVMFPGVNDVAQFLSVENHSFSEDTPDGSNTLLIHLQPCRARGAQTLPALSPPSLLQGDVGGVLVSWEPVSLATAYKVEIRTAGAGSWSPVDAVGRVQPAGAAPLLGTQGTCLAIAGLSAGMSYEARVSYVASCGCHCSHSDPSCPCILGAPQSTASHCGPCPPCLPQQLPTSQPVTPAPSMAVQAQAPPMPPPPQSPMMQTQGLSGHTPPPPPAPPAQSPKAPTIVQPLPQPEVYLSSVANAISVRWSTMGIPTAGYVVELRHASTAVSSRFACHATNDASGSLELCIQGLQPGQSYAACVLSVTQDGFESAPSPWSCWVTLPSIVLQSYDSVPCSYNPIMTMSSPVVKEQSMSPYSILFDEVEQPPEQVDTAKACPPPEITGQEDALFLD